MPRKTVRRPFTVVWYWRNVDQDNNVERIVATDAERAIAKFYRHLAEERTFSRRDIVVLAAFPTV
ncbi:hypothetical protein SEA_JFLIX2_43 [Rhodococcus phage Jflix2]|nr:hypothetical protein SEA_JFLIX2_43 [Rhodococcus phage Jflix2]